MKRKGRIRFPRKTVEKRILVAVIFFLVFGFFLACFLLTPKITLKGNLQEVVNVGSKYKEKGYKASYFKQNLNNMVIVKGKVNTKKQGVYSLYYSVKKGPFTAKAKRIVEVKDIEKPEITLKGEKDTKICPGTKYEEEGFEAKDNVDGDLTKEVKVKDAKDKIIYQVKDKSGNERKIVRTIVEKDDTPPMIELVDGENVFAYQGEGYQEAGYQAKDNCSGDVTNKVFITGEVDTNKLEDQTLTYEVMDEYENRQEVKRVVHIIHHNSPGTIYLTFDDGPKQGTTNVILDILKEENVKATFFVTGSGPDELIKREYDEGHTVGLHTYSHNYGTVYQSVDSYFKDLQAVHDRVQNITGYDSRIIRFPGGSSNTISKRYQQGLMTTLTKEVIARGYSYYDWNLESGDAGTLTSAEAIYQNVISHLSKNRVNMILMHDIKSYTRDALKKIIVYGKENGYHFEKITPQTEMMKQRINN